MTAAQVRDDLPAAVIMESRTDELRWFGHTDGGKQGHQGVLALGLKHWGRLRWGRLKEEWLRAGRLANWTANSIGMGAV